MRVYGLMKQSIVVMIVTYEPGESSSCIEGTLFTKMTSETG